MPINEKNYLKMGVKPTFESWYQIYIKTIPVTGHEGP
jgi:hypothetical protein